GYDFAGIAYGDGKFVAVTAAGTIVTSADRTNWVERPSGAPWGFVGISFTNGQFFAVARGAPVESHGFSTLMTSADGLNWTSREVGSTNNYGITPWLSRISDVPTSVEINADGRFVRVWHYWNDESYQSGSSIWTSTDGVNWVQRHSATGYAL